MDQTPMETGDRANHWDATYETRGTGSVSWFQPEPQVSLELIGALEVSGHKAVIDVGGGASFLTDRLVGRGWRDLTVLDVSASALDTARQRLPDDAPVTWLRQDLLAWSPKRRYGLWHDRAVFHFLVDTADQEAYLRVLRAALTPGGAVILATFALDGPERCSGLPIARYSPDDLAALLGGDFAIVDVRREEHTTPSGTLQPFSWIAAKGPGPG